MYPPAKMQRPHPKDHHLVQTCWPFSRVERFLLQTMEWFPWTMVITRRSIVLGVIWWMTALYLHIPKPQGVAGGPRTQPFHGLPMPLLDFVFGAFIWVHPHCVGDYPPRNGSSASSSSSPCGSSPSGFCAAVLRRRELPMVRQRLHLFSVSQCV